MVGLDGGTWWWDLMVGLDGGTWWWDLVVGLCVQLAIEKLPTDGRKAALIWRLSEAETF